jgi:hypothetical protein
MASRFFCDRDMGKSVGLALRAVGVDVQLYSERYASPLVPDERWIAEVTAEGLVILMKDMHVRTRPNERAVLERTGARAFVLATRGATKLQNLRAILIAWPRIEAEIASGLSPFMYGLDRAGTLRRYIPTEPRTSV